MTTDIERFEKKFIPEPMSGCWIWTASITGQGYGQMNIGGRHFDAHRVAWKLFKGDIPESLFVCHKCNVKSCVNPNHLYLATNSQNMRDAMKDGVKVGFQVINEKRRMARFCKRGHEYTVKNTYLIVVHGVQIGRRCKTCDRIKMANRRIYARSEGNQCA